MAALRDLTEFYDPDLSLPIGGVLYKITCPGITEADRLRSLVADETLTTAQEYAEVVKILGPVREEMARNGVPDTMAMHAGRTALLHFGGSPDMGRAHWQFAQLADFVDIQAMLDAGTDDTTTETKAD
ncbi:hypothetical protein [Nocardia terpenica]|uniref:DUF7426 domain-containing protein n=1 Tax=Nocardia terpenica TaxID=455432 RepID=A0A164PLW2_9NOCA|nr:hypothetical protein [Nocardia terpenica]KZM75743.1 hypothetical protein AWN90_20615 [Nocardia terpenica]NQE86256.1 hypothetical protein [Nocardia terpenica]